MELAQLILLAKWFFGIFSTILVYVIIITRSYTKLQSDVKTIDGRVKNIEKEAYVPEYLCLERRTGIRNMTEAEVYRTNEKLQSLQKVFDRREGAIKAD